MQERKIFQADLGQKIRRIRNGQNLTLEKLALEADLSYSQVSRIELGKINASAFILYRICRVLKINWGELLCPENINANNGVTEWLSNVPGQPRQDYIP